MSLLTPNSTKIMANAVVIKNLTKKPNFCSVDFDNSFLHRNIYQTCGNI